MTLTVGSLFSGIGGMDLEAHSTYVEPVGCISSVLRRGAVPALSRQGNVAAQSVDDQLAVLGLSATEVET